MASVKDIIKNSVYNSLAGGTGISFANIMMIFLMACLIAVYIYFVYKFISKAAFYSKDLNITIAGMVIIVTAIIIAMQANLIVSLGMVGALSIVRFRNAVKNPMDLLFLFWAVSMGILVGVNLVLLAIVTSLVLTILLYLLQMVPNSRAAAVLVLQVEEDYDNWEGLKEVLKKDTSFLKEKSRNVRGGAKTEIIYELRTKQEEVLLKDLKDLGIDEISFLEHDGEFRV